MGRVDELKGAGNEVSVRDLSKFPLALPSRGLQARDTLEDVLFAQDVNLDIRLEINSVRTLLDLVANTPLLTILSEESIHQVQGFDAVYQGDVPLGAGMSSSAALECCFANALNELFHGGLDKMTLALAGQATEHKYIGVKCGIMDQFISMFGREG